MKRTEMQCDELDVVVKRAKIEFHGNSGATLILDSAQSSNCSSGTRKRVHVELDFDSSDAVRVKRVRADPVGEIDPVGDETTVGRVTRGMKRTIELAFGGPDEARREAATAETARGSCLPSLKRTVECAEEESPIRIRGLQGRAAEDEDEDEDVVRRIRCLQPAHELTPVTRLGSPNELTPIKSQRGVLSFDALDIAHLGVSDICVRSGLSARALVQFVIRILQLSAKKKVRWENVCGVTMCIRDDMCGSDSAAHIITPYAPFPVFAASLQRTCRQNACAITSLAPYRQNDARALCSEWSHLGEAEMRDEWADCVMGYGMGNFFSRGIKEFCI